jgi:hypothetical protein
METNENNRELFEEKVFLDYFLKSVFIDKNSSFFIIDSNLTKAEFCERDGEYYKRTDVSAMWHGWKLCLGNLGNS